MIWRQKKEYSARHWTPYTHTHTHTHTHTRTLTHSLTHTHTHTHTHTRTHTHRNVLSDTVHPNFTLSRQLSLSHWRGRVCAAGRENTKKGRSREYQERTRCTVNVNRSLLLLNRSVFRSREYQERTRKSGVSVPQVKRSNVKAKETVLSKEPLSNDFWKETLF